MALFCVRDSIIRLILLGICLMRRASPQFMAISESSVITGKNLTFQVYMNAWQLPLSISFNYASHVIQMCNDSDASACSLDVVSGLHECSNLSSTANTAGWVHISAVGLCDIVSQSVDDANIVLAQHSLIIKNDPRTLAALKLPSKFERIYAYAVLVRIITGSHVTTGIVDVHVETILLQLHYAQAPFDILVFDNTCARRGLATTLFSALVLRNTSIGPVCFWECKAGSVRSPYNSFPLPRNSSLESTHMCLQLPVEFTAATFDVMGTAGVADTSFDRIDALAEDISLAMHGISAQVLTVCVLAGSIFDSRDLVDIVQQHVVQSNTEIFYTQFSITTALFRRRHLLQDTALAKSSSTAQVHGMVVIDNTHLSAQYIVEHLSLAASASVKESGMFTEFQVIPTSIHHVAKPRENSRGLSVGSQRLILYTSTGFVVVTCLVIMATRLTFKKAI